ncbi:hypothetical protein L596_004853 [Steinernema carpocapsae]|uniref:26S proteasome non-ATPase regulatory subunit 2 n=1 Tax=Steinernema carpocapsae TaxID=34508 RepID=A0A4U8UX20_STECR|nr:hypothetical protein L596_004853 [Steinernema carpocapsae]
MGEEVGSQMSLRTFGHLMRYGEPVIRRAVPLALALISISNPQLNILETLSKYSHDSDAETAHNAILAMGLVGRRHEQRPSGVHAPPAGHLPPQGPDQSHAGAHGPRSHSPRQGHHDFEPLPLRPPTNVPRRRGRTLRHVLRLLGWQQQHPQQPSALSAVFAGPSDAAPPLDHFGRGRRQAREPQAGQRLRPRRRRRRRGAGRKAEDHYRLPNAHHARSARLWRTS